MSHFHASNKYVAASHAVSKTRQIIMLYDGVIRLVTQAKEAIINKDIQQRYNLFEKASAVITGLQGALDFENGGEIAKLLDDFYLSIYMRMVHIQIHNNIELCDIVIKELTMMRDAWIEVDNKTSESAAKASDSSNNPFSILTDPNQLPDDGLEGFQFSV